MLRNWVWVWVRPDSRHNLCLRSSNCVPVTNEAVAGLSVFIGREFVARLAVVARIAVVAGIAPQVAGPLLRNGHLCQVGAPRTALLSRTFGPLELVLCLSWSGELQDQEST